MKSRLIITVQLLILQCLSYLCLARSYEFFYFVQMWPGSYCDTKGGCCYPKTGKPASDFTIQGLWPNNNNNSFPTNCKPNNPLNETQKSWSTLLCTKKNGNRKFWSHEWAKHGTCSQSVLDQHAYFAAALNIKDKINLLEILKNAGIQPDGKFYKVDDIKQAIKEGTGTTPVIECNVDPMGNVQLYQIYLCVDASASALIECPGFPRGNAIRP